ncbi:MAG TPA: acylphosphatase [Acidimicrobiales bacterium]|nr:acylphosphatase [Acidimicrobiales bacterium]
MEDPGEGVIVARRVLVDGRVQGVGYRQACAEAARRHGLSGWVRNRRDGRVEGLFEGRADAVAQMVQWCRSGPALARVTALQVEDVPTTGLSSFRVAAAD